MSTEVTISPISIAQIVAASGQVPTPVLYGWDGALIKPQDFRSPDGFGPGQPLKPTIDVPKYPPSEYQIQPGFNLIPLPGMEDGRSKLSHAQKRAWADLCPYYRIAVEYRKKQVRARKWAVVPAEDKRSAKARKAYEPQIKEAERFLTKPNRVDRLGISSWLGQAIEEALVLDALVFHKQRHYDGSLSYVQIDGATIKQIIDTWGHVIGYQQILWGLPRTQFTAPVYESYEVGELAYWVYNPRVTNTYGTSAIEEIIPIMQTAINRAQTHLAWYTKGSIPDAFLSSPPGWTAANIEEYQKWLDRELADLATKRKLRVVPNGATYTQAKPFSFTKEEEDAMASIILAHMGVPKMILVSQVNRATAETQQEDAGDVGLVPLLAWLEENLTDIVQGDLGFEDLCVICADGLASQDAADTDNDVKLITAKVVTPDEVRAKRGLEPLTDTADPNAPKKIPLEALTRAVFEAGVATRDEVRASLNLPPAVEGGTQYVTVGAFSATPPEMIEDAPAGTAPAPMPGAPPAKPGAAPLPIPGGGSDAERDSVVSHALASLTGKPVEEPAAVKSERAAWRRHALRRWDKGQSPSSAFTAGAIAGDVAARIRKALIAARTREEVAAAFEKKDEMTDADREKAMSVVRRAAAKMFAKEKEAVLAAAKAKLKDEPKDEA